MDLLFTPEPFVSTTEVIENSASARMASLIPLTIRRSGVSVLVSRGSKYTDEYDLYGVHSNVSPYSEIQEFTALLLISDRKFITWSETSLQPVLGKYGFVNYEALPGDILTYNGQAGIQRFRYMVREPESCGLTRDIAFRVKLLARGDLND
jgi:hypothetical protein